MKKLCKDDEEINPDTGRCRKKCPDDKERNPLTGRCVKKSSKKSPKKATKKGVSCKDDEEINPDTGRCRKKCKEGEIRDTKSKRCRKNKISPKKTSKPKKTSRPKQKSVEKNKQTVFRKYIDVDKIGKNPMDDEELFIFSNPSPDARYYWEKLFDEEERIHHQIQLLCENKSDTAVDFLLEKVDELNEDNQKLLLEWLPINENDKAVDYMIKKLKKMDFFTVKNYSWATFLLNKNDKSVDYIIDVLSSIDLTDLRITRNLQLGEFIGNQNKNAVHFILTHLEELEPYGAKDSLSLMNTCYILDFYLNYPADFMRIKEDLPKSFFKKVYKCENIFNNGRINNLILDLTEGVIDDFIYSNPSKYAFNYWDAPDTITNDALEFLYLNESDTAAEYLIQMSKSPFSNKIDWEKLITNKNSILATFMFKRVFKNMFKSSIENTKILFNQSSVIPNLIINNIDDLLDTVGKKVILKAFLSVEYGNYKQIDRIVKFFMYNHNFIKYNDLAVEYFRRNKYIFRYESIFV